MVVSSNRPKVRGVCQKAHQHTTLCKCLLNCSPAPHQSLTGGENQEDQEAAGCVVHMFSGTYISLHKRPGQRLTIAKDGERNGPLPTTQSTRSDDDDNSG